MKKFLVNVLLVFVSIVVALVVADIALHYTPLHYRYVSPQAPQGYFRYDPELGYDITPSFATSTHIFSDYSYPIWSNKLGCFDYEYDGSAPYIYIGGDSMAWGFAPLDDKWGKVIQQQTGIRTLTCGENGYGTRQEVIKAKRELAQLPQPPKVIIVSYYENDTPDDTNFPNYNVLDGYVVFGEGQCGPAPLLDISPLEATTTCNVSRMHYPPFQKIKFELGLHSVLYSMLTQSMGNQIKVSLQGFPQLSQILSPVFPWLAPKAPTLTEKKIEDDKGNSSLVWQFHESNFLAFKKLADSYHAKLLFVLIPGVDTLSATTTSPAWDNEKVADFLTASHIDHLELWQEFHDRKKEGDRTFYWPVNSHMNIAGNHLAGLLVTKHLLEHGIVKDKNTQETLARLNEELEKDFPRTR